LAFLPGKEAVELALGEAEAMFLASNIIFNDEGLGNWLNCANKLGLRDEADAIKRLSKKLLQRLFPSAFGTQSFLRR